MAVVQWLSENRQWVFSGIGVLILSAMFSVVVWLLRSWRSIPPGEVGDSDARGTVVRTRGANHGQMITAAGDVHIHGNVGSTSHSPGGPAPAANTPAASATPSASSNASHERDRDREVVREILGHVSTKALESLMSDIDSRRLDTRDLWFHDWMRDYRESVSFHIYDQELRTSFDKLAENIDKATSHSEIFDDVPNDPYAQRVSAAPGGITRQERDRVMRLMFEENEAARRALHRFVGRVRALFPDLSLEDLDLEARRRHSARS